MSPSDSSLSTAPIYDAATLDPAVVARRADELAKRLTWSRAEVLEFQRDRLSEMLRHAAGASPYYQEKIGHLVAAGAPLQSYPTMNKTVLMAEFDRIVTDRRLTRALVEQHAASRDAGQLLLGEYRVASTGGSSGQRGVFVYDSDAWLETVANIRRMQRLMRLPPNMKSIGVGAPSPVHLSNRFYAEGRAGVPDAPRLSVITPIEDVVAALNRFQPDIISTYPSFIRRLAEEQSAGRLRISPRLVRSVAEALSPDVRTLVRATWNVPVTNNYASTEAGIMGMDCLHLSGIHLCDDMIIVEVVDDANQPVPAGVQGARILVTTLYNRTLPIVRYEFSDLLTEIGEPCACGCPFKRIKDIDGRREEMLNAWTPDGQQVDVHAPRFWFHLVRVPGIRHYQFIQLENGIGINIVPNADHDAAQVRRSVEDIARAALADLGAAGCHVEVRIVDEIARTGASAKIKLIGASPAH